MASSTQIVCLHEGEQGRSIDPVFINSLLKGLDPAWLRPWKGNNIIRCQACGGRDSLIEAMPTQLKSCLSMGGSTTLMVWADLDDDKAEGDELKQAFWVVARQAGITEEQFSQVVFVFAKDRIENWIEFLITGNTDENVEGARQKHGRVVASAARELAKKCKTGAVIANIPPSLEWSCRNWKTLVARMK